MDGAHSTRWSSGPATRLSAALVRLRYNVSTLDLLLNCGPKVRDIILAGTP
jgi:hypothetical protein